MAFFDAAFSDGGGYNTITSPDETAAASTGNEQTGTQKFSMFKSDDLPFKRIMSAVMRSAAAVQGQEQAKAVMGQQSDANSKMSVNLRQGDNGPIVTVKNAPVDLLNQTQQNDLKQAYTQPQQQVEKKIAAMNGGAQAGAQAAGGNVPTSPPPADHPLERAASALDESLGYRVIRPWGDEIRNSTSSLESLVDVGERLGIPDARKHAEDAWKRLQKGQLSPESVRRNLANMAAKKIEVDSHNLQTTLNPYREADQQAQSEIDRQRTATRLEQTQRDTERKQVLKEKEDVIKNTDWHLIPFSEWRQNAEAQNTTGVPLTDFEFNHLVVKGQQDVAKNFQHFISTRGEGTFALGDYPTWDAAKAAFGWDNVQAAFAKSPNAIAAMDKQGYAAWDAAHKYATKKANEATRKEERDNLQMERTRQILAAATREKPATIGRGDVNLMSVDELLAIDPSTVKNYAVLLRQKHDLLLHDRKKAKDAFDLAAGERDALAGSKPGYDDWRFSNEYKAKQIRAASAKRDLDEIDAELQKLTRTVSPSTPPMPTPQSQAQAPQQPKPPAAPFLRPDPWAQPATTQPPKQVAPAKSEKKGPPRVGDKKTFTAGPYAGKTGTWDGISYVIPR